MRRLKKILQSTLTKVISMTLLILFVASIFIFHGWYVRKFNEFKGYYWVYKGDKAYKKHDLQSAINYYEYGIKLHPRHYRAMYNLANIYVVYEDYYSALYNYEKALKICPDYEVARIDYAIILSETYKTDKAIEEYKKVLDNEKKFKFYHHIPFLFDKKKTHKYNRGVAYYNMGIAYRTKSLLAGLNVNSNRYYLSKASDSYSQAVDILKSYNSNYNLGLIHQLLKNTNQAGYYYCKAMEIEPMEYESHFNLGVLLSDIKDYTGAAEEFKKAGLLLDSKGDSNKTKYIYEILDQVNQKIAIANTDKDYYKKLREDEEKNMLAKYKSGKLVLDFDNKKENEEFINSFRVCSGYERFLGENENE